MPILGNMAAFRPVGNERIAGMKRFLTYALVVAAAIGAALCITAYRYEPRIRSHTYIGAVAVGGMLPEEAKRKLRIWWEAVRYNEVTVRVDKGRLQPSKLQVAKLGFRLDDEASVAQLPLDDFWEKTGEVLKQSDLERAEFNPVLFANTDSSSVLEHYVRKSIGELRPPRVRLAGGIVVREPEVAGYEVDQGQLPGALVGALRTGDELSVPIIEADKRVPDSELDKIVGVESEFTTRFPSRQFSRNANIRLAAQKLDGTLVMPGEVFSFNKTVGERTIKDGYRLAGIYRNGKHDLGIGGGICQVSGTLYNAILLANLKIVQRHNHSMPVAYLPVGKDATVDYRGPDLGFRNESGLPVAISSEFVSGKLTFRILGVPNPSRKVKIVTSDLKSWGRGVKYVDDSSLPPGKEKVIEKGSSGHSVNTHRIVLLDGKEVSREFLGRSHYAGGVRIIAKNLRAAANAAPPLPGGQETPPIGPDRALNPL